MLLPPEEIDTPRLHLRRPASDHGSALDEAVAASIDELEPVFRWAQVQVRLGRSDEAGAHRLDRELAWDDHTAWTWFAFTREEPETLVAEICLKTANWNQGALEYFVWVRSDHTGRGYGTEASDAVFEIAFGDLEADLIEARVAASNAPSRRMLTRLGFEHHGTLWDYDRLVLFPMSWARSLYRRRLGGPRG